MEHGFAIIGLGYVGLPVALALARKCEPVIGFDISQQRIAALREGWAWAPRRWTQVSTDTGVGDPRKASPEKGERYMSDVVQRLSRFLIDLAAADPNDLYG